MSHTSLMSGIVLDQFFLKGFIEKVLKNIRCWKNLKSEGEKRMPDTKYGIIRVQNGALHMKLSVQ